MNLDQAKALREPFAQELIGKLPRVYCGDCRNARFKVCEKHTRTKCRDCGNNITNAHLHLDYVGHAEITDRLLAVDPEWAWEPVAFDGDGLPKVDQFGGLWIRLTVAGVTRLGYGHADGKSGPDAVKEAIGDALRNAAMRFGVALDLWGAKFKETEDAEAADQPAHANQPAHRPAAQSPAATPSAVSIRDWVLQPGRTPTEILNAKTKLLKEHPPVAAERIQNEHGDQEQLVVFMARRAREAGPADAAPAEQEDTRRKRMFALFNELGFGGEPNREQRRAIASKVLGRQIGSMTEVTGDDQEKVIKALESKRGQRRQPAGATA